MNNSQILSFDLEQAKETERKNRIEPEKLLPLLRRIKKQSPQDYAKIVSILCIYGNENYLNIR